MKYKDQLKDRILGCLLGGALGDTMGFATEGHHYKTVRAKYGLVNRLITRDFGDELTPPVTKPVYTDDTVMRHMVCRTIFDTDGYPTIEALAKVWRESITDFEHWHWWNNTRIIGAKLKWGQWLDLRNLGSDSIACNDASMIIAPVGLLNPCNPRLAALEALELSGLWQNSYSRDCAAAMAAAHSQAVSPDATIDTVIETAKKYSGKLSGYITRAIKLAEEVKSPETFTEEYYKRFVPGPNEDYWCGISSHKDGSPWCFNADPLEVCSLGIAFFKICNANTKDAMAYGATFGRDCDTIAGIAGSLSGALNGSASVPKDLVDEMMENCPEVDIFDYAEKLSSLAINKAIDFKQRVSKITE